VSLCKCTRCEHVEHKGKGKSKWRGASPEAEKVLWVVDRPRKWHPEGQQLACTQPILHAP
jgi:hypothetical protein